MKLGQAARQEFEYIRHGTTPLIGIWDVVVGKMFSETIGLTRNEADFVNHIYVIHPIHKASLEDALLRGLPFGQIIEINHANLEGIVE